MRIQKPGLLVALLFFLGSLGGAAMATPKDKGPAGTKAPTKRQKLSFKQAMQQYRAFLAIRIKSTNARAQGAQILSKIKSYDSAIRLLVKASKTKTEQLCTQYRVAEGKYQIAEAILQAPIPTTKGLKLTPNIRQAYKEQIDMKFVAPLLADARKKCKKAQAFQKKYKLSGPCATGLKKLRLKLQPAKPAAR